MKSHWILGSVFLFLLTSSPVVSAQSAGGDELKALRWSEERAWDWYDDLPWLVGCNFIPSTAINQLEMWQEATWDPETIDRELGLAAGLGFNIVRVYLHDLAYDQDPQGFLGRVDAFLDLTKKHDLRVMLVLFDDCWLPEPQAGPQPEPLPGVHNSGWLQSPGKPALVAYPNDAKLRRRLETYVKAVLERFKDDSRVLIWDLYNEPGGKWYQPPREGKSFQTGAIGELCLPLLRDVYVWAREVAPSQPLTTCFYSRKDSEKAAAEWADVISFHHYGSAKSLKGKINKFQQYQRPILCTEYMARHAKSTFQGSLPVMKEENVGAINWGLVAGKSNTIYPWESWKKPGKTPEPDLWFHDIFRPDGTAFDPREVELIRSLTKR